jgi:hypothetical protein
VFVFYYEQKEGKHKDIVEEISEVGQNSYLKGRK